MEIYNSFSEKQIYFKHTLISDINTLQVELEKFKPETKETSFGITTTQRFLFRGVSNSSFKIYSSMQRCCFERNNRGQNISMNDLSEEIFKRFNESEILTSAFNEEVANPSNKSDLAKWAFIQHFGGPSHFVDFTSDINQALFFALHEESSYNKDNDDLNNYISIYVYPDNPLQKGNLNAMYESASQQGRSLFVNTTEKYPNISINTDDADRQMLTQPLNNKFWGASIYGEEIFQITLPGDGSNNSINLKNTHISKQNGNFFLGNIETLTPLELAPNLRITQVVDCNTEMKYSIPYGYCLDIHKSLISDINESFQIPEKDDVYTPSDYIQEAKLELKSLWLAEKRCFFKKCIRRR